MKYGVSFIALAVALTAIAWLNQSWAWALLWPAVSFAVMGAGYLGLGARVTGKRADGTLAWWAILLLLPYLTFAWFIWYLVRLLSREAACNKLTSDVLIGRRLLAQELPPGVDCVVDLTSEFAEPFAVRTAAEYIAFPMLDAGVATPQSLAAFAVRLTRRPEKLYIHCAQGHGRTGLIASLVLLAKGEATSAEHALQQVQAARPGVRLNTLQMKTLLTTAKLMAEEAQATADQSSFRS